MDNEYLAKHLQHKERTLGDLGRFVKTKAGKTANFTLFLGAGCSVSSGVRPATALVEEWIKELTADSGASDIQSARAWLTTNRSEWYNRDHEYSCLFEKRFDLPSQRRAFVEEEVAGKFPSLGYAYLMRLIENGYFNTVFTTNFDDLLNEAFHLFSSQQFGGSPCMSDLMRPIVCAHDSSVRSVSISSARPKIIKLHGDYLYDDIKSTLRETESLEENIRDKFVEFCKEFGLVVVGYAGNDRSVMDVLNYLLKSDDYLKNGVYWCIRREDAISDELKKLLWKDRVYYVFVDGFDELCAELFNQLVSKDELPVPLGALGLNNQVLERLASNSLLKTSKSRIIQNDLRRLSEENTRNSYFNEIKSVIFGDDSKDFARSLTTEQTVKLLEVERLLDKKQFDRALELISNHLIEEPNLSYEYKVRLMRLRANVLYKMGKTADAVKECDNLIKLSNGYSYEYYLLKNRFTNSYKKRIENLRKYLAECPHDYRAYELISGYEWQLVQNSCSSRDLCSQLLIDLNAGIRCNPTIENPCFTRKFSCLAKKKELFCGDWKNQLGELKRMAEDQNSSSPTAYSFRLQYDNETVSDPMRRKANLDENWGSITEAIVGGRFPFKRYFAVLVQILNESEEEWSVRSEFIQSQIEKNEWQYHTSHSFLTLAIEFFLYKQRNIRQAFKYLMQIPEDIFEISDLTALQDVVFLAKDSCIEGEAKELYERMKDTFSDRVQKEFLMNEAVQRKDYSSALEMARRQMEEARYEREYFTFEMHAKLWLGLFQEVYDTSQDALRDGANWTGNDADVINYQIARIRLGKKAKKDKLEPIADYKESSEVKAAALVLLERFDEACTVLTNALQHDLKCALACKTDYVFQMMGNERIRDVISTACKVIG